MRLIPYRGDDFGGLTALRDRMNRLFDSFSRGEEPHLFGARRWLPPVDVLETPETLQIKVELPGIDPKDMDVSVVGNTLVIKGEKTAEKEDTGKTWHRRECIAGTFLRSVELPVEVDADHVGAVNKAGVLLVTLPKREQASAKRIQVKGT